MTTLRLHLTSLCASSAHAGLSPWEGQNALDAAVLAYTSVGLLRQQIKPTHRVHGVFGGQDWAPNSLLILVEFGLIIAQPFRWP